MHKPDIHFPNESLDEIQRRQIAALTEERDMLRKSWQDTADMYQRVVKQLQSVTDEVIELRTIMATAKDRVERGLASADDVPYLIAKVQDLRRRTHEIQAAESKRHKQTYQARIVRQARNAFFWERAYDDVCEALYKNQTLATVTCGLIGAASLAAGILTGYHLHG